MNTELELISAIEGYPDVIVYGAKARGWTLIERLKTHYLRSHIHVAAQNSYDKYCAGYLINRIEDYKHLINSCIVLIAARPCLHNEMESTARSLGFTDIIFITDILQADLTLRYENFLGRQMIKKNHFLQYQSMNLLLLNDLRTKVKRGEKANVVFVLTSRAKFNFASVYLALATKQLFDVSIYVFEENYYQDHYNVALNDDHCLSELNETKNYADFLRQNGFNVVWGYDENNIAISIEELKPDIIFYNACYCGFFSFRSSKVAEHGLMKAVINHLSCYLSYGMLISNYQEYHFENDNIFPAWLFFLGNRQEYSLALNNYVTNGTYNVLSGHPMFDPYINGVDYALPDKLKNKKKIIVYAPHWSFTYDDKKSVFDIFSVHVFRMLQEYPDIGFVYKPHPLLNSRMQCAETDILSPAEYNDYCTQWENSQNGIIVNDSSFIELFKVSDLLITDSYTFILAWLPTEKPCIYLKNPDVEMRDFYRNYLEHIRPVLDSYYICDNADDVKSVFDEVVIAGNDKKADERKKQKEEVIYNLGHAGEYIADYIEKQIMG